MKKFIKEKYEKCKNYGTSFYEKHVKGGIKPYLWLFLLTAVLYYMFFPHRLNGTLESLRFNLNIGIVILLVVFIVFFIVRIIKNRLTAEYLIGAALAAAVIMRLYYMLTNPTWEHTYDAGYTNGHFDYTKHIFEGLGLPAENNHGQYYHPPFFHSVNALMMRLSLIIYPYTDVGQLFGVNYIINAFASIVFIIFALKLLREFGLKSKFLLLAFCFTAFNYGAIMAVGFMNNDALAAMFFILCIYFSVKWYKNPNVKTIICIALCFGLGTMTKISVMLTGIFIAIMFLNKYFKQIKTEQPKKKFNKKYIWMFGIFLLIAVPLAVWHPIRQLILFNQAPNYVHKIGGPDSWLYVGDVSFAERFLIFPFWKIFEPDFMAFQNDENVWTQVLRTFTFWEGRGALPDAFDNNFYIVVLLFHAIFLIITVCLAIAGLVYAIKHKKLLLKCLAIFSFIFLLSFLYFTIQEPFACAPNFRYIMFISIPLALFAVYALQNITPRYKIQSVFTWIFGCFTVIYFSLNLIFALVI